MEYGYFTCVFVCHLCAVLTEIRKDHKISWAWSYTLLWATLRVLGIKPGSPGRSASILDTIAPSLLPRASVAITCPTVCSSLVFFSRSALQRPPVHCRWNGVVPQFAFLWLVMRLNISSKTYCQSWFLVIQKVFWGEWGGRDFFLFHLW